MLEVIVSLLGVALIFAYLFGKILAAANARETQTFDNPISIFDVFNGRTSIIYGLLFFILALLTAHMLLVISIESTSGQVLSKNTTTRNNYTLMNVTIPFLNQSGAVFFYNETHPFIQNYTVEESQGYNDDVFDTLNTYFSVYTWVLFFIISIAVLMIIVSFIRRTIAERRKIKSGEKFV